MDSVGVDVRIHTLIEPYGVATSPYIPSECRFT